MKFVANSTVLLSLASYQSRYQCENTWQILTIFYLI